MQIGSILRRMRKGAGMSQEQLALELHISRSNVSRVETDELELRTKDFLRWCKITQCQEALIALMCGMDLSTVQQIIDTITNTTLVGTIIKWGGYLHWINIF